MKSRKLHEWDLSYEEARSLQIRLAKGVQFVSLQKKPIVVAGLDCAFSKDEKRIFAAVVVIKLPGFEVIEMVSAARKLTFPYIPGLLSFREAPVCIDAIEKLKHKPDIFIVDGQGVAHPRRFGIACHIGLFVNRPTANVCTPTVAVGKEGRACLVWSETSDGGKWGLKMAEFDVNSNQWQKPKDIESSGNPRYCSAGFDKDGRIWVAYSVQTNEGRRVAVKQIEEVGNSKEAGAAKEL